MFVDVSNAEICMHLDDMMTSRLLLSKIDSRGEFFSRVLCISVVFSLTLAIRPVVVSATRRFSILWVISPGLKRVSLMILTLGLVLLGLAIAESKDLVLASCYSPFSTALQIAIMAFRTYALFRTDSILTRILLLSVGPVSDAAF